MPDVRSFPTEGDPFKLLAQQVAQLRKEFEDARGTLLARATGGGGVAVSSASVATDESTTSTTFTDLATTGPAITMTTGTFVLVVMSAQLWNVTAGHRMRMSFTVSGVTTVPAADARANRVTSSGASQSDIQSLVIPLSVTAGSNTFTAKYAIGDSDTGAGHASYRHLIVIAP